MAPLAKVELISLWEVPVDVTAAVRDLPSTHVAVVPVAGASPSLRLEEPSTLVLALVGVGVLATFRGVRKRVARRPTMRRVEPPRIRPRRRAA